MPQSGSLAGEARSPLRFDAAPATRWLKAGWRDLWTQPLSSLGYGVLVFVVSWLIVGSLMTLDLSAYLFPALAGFLIVGPILALGLYHKSRCLETGEPVTLRAMILVRAKSAAQILFSGVLLCLLLLLWMRAAVILYALFFGLRPFAGLDQILPFLFGTLEGWGLLVVGSAVGGLFAAFTFAISVFGIPLLYDQRTDVFTAMAISLSTVWRQLGIMLPWAAAIVLLGVANLVSGCLAMVVTFPLLGHATWHAYREVCDLSRLD